MYERVDGHLPALVVPARFHACRHSCILQQTADGQLRKRTAVQSATRCRIAVSQIRYPRTLPQNLLPACVYSQCVGSRQPHTSQTASQQENTAQIHIATEFYHGMGCTPSYVRPVAGVPSALMAVCCSSTNDGIHEALKSLLELFVSCNTRRPSSVR